MTFILPPSKVVGFEEAANFYWHQHCSPDSESHVLPSLKNPGSERDPCALIARLIKPALVLKGFRLTTSLLKDCCDLSLIKEPCRANVKVNIDAVVICPSFGVLFIFYLPKNIPDNYFHGSAPESVEQSSGFIAKLFHERVPSQTWFIIQNDASTVPLREANEFKILQFGDIPRETSVLLDCRTPSFDYEYVGSTLLAIWCKKLSTRHFKALAPNAHQNMNHPTTPFAPTPNEQPSCLGKFLDDCCASLTTVCPKWNEPSSNRPYMLPPMFSYKYKEPFQTRTTLHCPEWVKAAPKGIERNIHGDNAEFMTYRNIENGARERRVKLVTFHGIKVNQAILRKLSYPLELLPVDGRTELELDFVCVSPKFGFVLVEVKGATAATSTNTVKHVLQTATAQLDCGAKLLERICHQIGINFRKQDCAKLVVFPFLTRDKLEQATRRANRNENKSNVAIAFGSDRWILEEHCTRSVFQGINIFRRLRLRRIYEAITPVLAKILVSEDRSSFSPTLPVLEEARKLAKYELMGEAAGRGTRSNVLQSDRLIDDDKVGSRRGAKVSNSLSASTSISQNPDVVYFLTPEQVDAFNGPSHQLIEGCAGTGKTILLQARLKYLHSIGYNVFVFARGVFLHTYVSFVKANSMSDRRDRVTWCYDISRLKEKFRMTYVAVSKTPRYAMSTWVAQMVRADKQTVWVPPLGMNALAEDLSIAIKHDLEDSGRGMRAEYDRARYSTNPWAVLIDDSFSFSDEDTIKIIWCLLKAQNEFPASVWAAYDPQLVQPKQLSILSGVHVGYLHAVLRNSIGVHQLSHADVSESSFVGHNFAGMLPRLHDITEIHDSRVVKKIASIIEEELNEILHLGTKAGLLRHAAVLLDDTIRHLQIDAPLNFKFCKVPHLMALISNELNSLVIPCTTIEGQMKAAAAGKDSLAVDISDNAHSLEWPVVFVIRYKYDNTKWWVWNKMNYIARSRGVVCLVEITIDIEVLLKLPQQQPQQAQPCYFDFVTSTHGYN